MDRGYMIFNNSGQANAKRMQSRYVGRRRAVFNPETGRREMRDVHHYELGEPIENIGNRTYAIYFDVTNNRTNPNLIQGETCMTSSEAKSAGFPVDIDSE